MPLTYQVLPKDIAWSARLDGPRDLSSMSYGQPSALVLETKRFDLDSSLRANFFWHRAVTLENHFIMCSERTLPSING